MKTYNRYQHCGETFYTGTQIEEIVCSECETRIEYDDIIKTREAIAKQETIKPVEVLDKTTQNT